MENHNKMIKYQSLTESKQCGRTNLQMNLFNWAFQTLTFFLNFLVRWTFSFSLKFWQVWNNYASKTKRREMEIMFEHHISNVWSWFVQQETTFPSFDLDICDPLLQSLFDVSENFISHADNSAVTHPDTWGSADGVCITIRLNRKHWRILTDLELIYLAIYIVVIWYWTSFQV